MYFAVGFCLFCSVFASFKECLGFKCAVTVLKSEKGGRVHIEQKEQLIDFWAGRWSEESATFLPGCTSQYLLHSTQNAGISTTRLG